MLNHRQRIRQIERCLAGRRLIYFGTRGTDARSLLDIANFEEVFSQVAPFEAVSILETCLEVIKGERVDLDTYSIDQDASEAVREVRKNLLRAFSRPAAVVPYRPCAVLASACFTRANLVRYMGLFHDFQACFEHKPWVETQLAALGIRLVPWTYFADDDGALIREAAEAGPIVLRTNRSDGGAGLALVEDPSHLQCEWPAHVEGFLAVAPYLYPAIPLNVNACVFPGGEVSLHAPSLQLIGIPACTNRKFGYCGNDFAKIGDLDSEILDDLETIVNAVGRWLGSQGYLGVFGIDALVHEGIVYLVEVNPRFQGSSALASQLARELDRPDLFLDHIASFLALSPSMPVRLRELARAQAPLSHIVCHNYMKKPLEVRVHPHDTSTAMPHLLPRFGVRVQPEAILFSLTFKQPVTDTGLVLLPPVEKELLCITDLLYGEGPATINPLTQPAESPLSQEVPEQGPSACTPTILSNLLHPLEIESSEDHNR